MKIISGQLVFLEFHTKDLSPTVQVITMTFNLVIDYSHIYQKQDTMLVPLLTKHQYLEIHFLIWENKTYLHY